MSRSSLATSLILLAGCSTVRPPNTETGSGGGSGDELAADASGKEIQSADSGTDLENRSGFIRLGSNDGFSKSSMVQTGAIDWGQSFPSAVGQEISPSDLIPSVPPEAPYSQELSLPPLLGGGSGSGSASAESFVSGFAINGYMANALVFQDKNKNLFLDLNEKVSITTEDGSFRLEGAAPGEGQVVVKSISDSDLAELLIASNRLGVTPVLSALEQGTTYRDSLTGDIKDFHGYFLSNATTSEVFVNPFSTLVASQVDNSSQIASLLEMVFGINPNTDHVAAGQTDVNLLVAANALSTLIQAASQVLPNDASLQAFTEVLVDEIASNVPTATDLYSAHDVSRLISNTSRMSELLEQTYLEQTGRPLETDLKVSFEASYVSKVEGYARFWQEPDLFLATDSGSSSFDKVSNAISFGGIFILDEESYSIVVQNVDTLGNTTNLNFPSNLSGIDLKDPSTFSTLSDGRYQVTLINSEGESRSLGFFKDTLAPAVDYSQTQQLSPLAFDSMNSFISGSDADNVTNASDLSTEFLQTIRSQLASGERLQYRVTSGDQDTPSDWREFLNVPELGSGQLLIEDAYTLEFRTIDEAGNAGLILSREVVFDNRAPVVLEESVSLKSDTGRFDDDFISQDVSLELIPLNESEWYVFKMEALEQSLYSQNWVFSNFTPPEKDGFYTVFVKAIDLAGNESMVETFQFTLDTTAPLLLANDNVINPETFNYDELAYSYLYPLSQDNNDGFLQYKVHSTDNPEVSESWEWSYSLPSQLESGHYEIYVRRADTAGNISPEESYGPINYQTIKISSFKEEDIERLLATDFSSGESIESAVGADDTWITRDLSLAESPEVALNTVLVQVDSDTFSSSTVFEKTFLSDATQRTSAVNANFDNFFVAPTEGSTYFSYSSNTAQTSDEVGIGGAGNDKATGLGVGDIFVGGEGIDIASFSNQEEILGVGFLSADEEAAYNSYFAALDLNTELYSDSTIKIFSRSPGQFGTEEGISVISSEVIQHGNAGEKLYFLNDGVLRLSGENDTLFLDGEGIAVNGSGGADTLIGGGGNDVLISGLGDPTLQAQERLYGNNGNDQLIVSDGGLNSPNNILVDAGVGDDEVYITHGNTQIDTGTGADIVFIAPMASDLSNRIITEVYNLSPVDKVVLGGVDSAARLGLVSNFDDNVLYVDLTHVYHNYSDLEIAMGSTLSMSLSQEYAGKEAEETLLGILEFEEAVGLPDDLAILV